jgi:hypothetical protein
MKFPLYAPFVLAALCALPVAAQQPDSAQPQNPQPQTSEPAAQPQTQAQPQQAQAQPQGPAISAKDLSPLTGELESKLDSKNAKPGDSVVLKTTEKTVMANGTVIPKGSKIMGHVTGVQAHDDQSPNGQLTLQFDQAQLKGGQSLPLLSTLQSVSPSESAAADSSPMPMASAPSGGSAAPSSGTSGGGSMGSSGTANAQASRPAQPQPGAMAQSGGAQSSGPAPGTEVARKGNIVIRTTSMPGLFVAANVDGLPFSNASGVLICAKKDVHLDGGTKVELAVAEPPAGGAR